MTDAIMDEAHLSRLAVAGNALRPDWPVASLRTFLAKHFANRAYRDVALVLVNVATAEPPTETPRLLLENWPWQIVTLASRRSEADKHPSSVKLGDLCPECFRHNCDCDPKRTEARRRVNAARATERGAAMARAQLLQARKEAAHGHPSDAA